MLASARPVITAPDVALPQAPQGAPAVRPDHLHRDLRGVPPLYAGDRHAGWDSLRRGQRDGQNAARDRMRILHVSEVHWGGVVSLIREFVAGQQAAGDEVLVLAPGGFPCLPGTATEHWSWVRERPTSYPAAWLELRRTVQRFRPDVIHLHSFMAGLVGRLPGAVAGTPIVYQPHAWSFDLVGRPAFSRSLQTWERLSSRRTDIIVTNCQAEIDEGRATGIGTDAVSIGVAVDPARFHPVGIEARERYRRECGLRLPKSVVCVGRLVRQKGQDLLVKEWERSRPEATELVLVGPGDIEPLKALAPTQWGVTIRAVGEQQDVRPWLWASDLLVLPSRYETVAIVVAEAMSCGIPVVATAVNGTEEVVTAGRRPAAGRIVPVGDMTALVQQARKLLDDPETTEQMALAGIERSAHQFTREDVVARLRGAYVRAMTEVVPRSSEPRWRSGEPQAAVT